MSGSVTSLNRCIVEPVANLADLTIQPFNDSTISFANRQRRKIINTRLLRQITRELLLELKIENAELGVNLVAAKEMAALNWKFLQHEGSTDVITFDHGEKRKAESGKRKCLHGELFICVNVAVSQAKNFKTSWQSEIVRYIVHGVLHLLGHDDLTPALRRKMKSEENRRLRALAKKFSLAQIGGGSKLRA
jgi:probable rRNA maturation factor